MNNRKDEEPDCCTEAQPSNDAVEKGLREYTCPTCGRKWYTEGTFSSGRILRGVTWKSGKHAPD